MANILNRWAEYKAGSLTPPVIVQVDLLSGTYLGWVWTGKSIQGPFSKTEYSATTRDEIISLALSFDRAEPDTVHVICEDGTVFEGLVEDSNPHTQTDYNIDLTINPTSQQAAAWNLVRPLLATHLRKVNRVYQRLSEGQQRVLREHCPIFNAVLALTEDEE